MHLRFAVLALAVLLGLPSAALAQGNDDEWAAGAGGQLAFTTQNRDGVSFLQMIGPDGQRSAQEVVGDRFPSPLIAVGPRGDAILVWYDREKTLWLRYRPAAGVLGAPEAVAAPVDWSEGSVAIGLDGAGTATVVYLPETPDQSGDVTVRTRTEAGAWSPPQVLADSQDVFAPALAVTPNGSAVLAWRQSGDRKRLNAAEVAVSTRAAGVATFSPVQRVVAWRRNPSEPTVAANDRGDAVIGWSELRKGSIFEVHARFRGPGTGFGPALKLNRTRDMAGPWVTATPSGRIVLGWTSNLKRRAEGRVRLASGKLGPVRKFSEDLAENSDLFPLAVGRGAIAWADRDPDVSRLRIAHTTPGGRILKGETITRVRGWTVGPAFAVGPQGVLAVASRPLRPDDPIRWLRVP